MWAQSTSVTDRQTDRITITNTVQRIASHGKNRTSRGFSNKMTVTFIIPTCFSSIFDTNTATVL